jgi:prepilin-type processing-associated H-X9-DG protein
MTRRVMPTPARIEEDAAAREVVITWADGHVSRYTYRLLRYACPCAVCVHEWTGEKLLDPSRVSADIRPKQIAQVGAYALRFTWSDGHMTGIYPFSLLRSLCQCDACTSSTADSSTAPLP